MIQRNYKINNKTILDYTEDYTTGYLLDYEYIKKSL